MELFYNNITTYRLQRQQKPDTFGYIIFPDSFAKKEVFTEHTRKSDKFRFPSVRYHKEKVSDREQGNVSIYKGKQETAEKFRRKPT